MCISGDGSNMVFNSERGGQCSIIFYFRHFNNKYRVNMDMNILKTQTGTLTSKNLIKKHAF